ncbi:hypothetical protein BC940DRAFT_301221, partial [Gongronella butleri]
MPRVAPLCEHLQFFLLRYGLPDGSYNSSMATPVIINVDADFDLHSPADEVSQDLHCIVRPCVDPRNVKYGSGCVLTLRFIQLFWARVTLLKACADKIVAAAGGIPLMTRAQCQDIYAAWEVEKALSMASLVRPCTTQSPMATFTAARYSGTFFWFLRPAARSRRSCDEWRFRPVVSSIPSSDASCAAVAIVFRPGSMPTNAWVTTSSLAIFASCRVGGQPNALIRVNTKLHLHAVCAGHRVKHAAQESQALHL